MFEIHVGQKTLEYKKFVFNGGEVSVKLNFVNTAEFLLGTNTTCYLKGNIENSDDVFELMLLVDAIRNRLHGG